MSDINQALDDLRLALMEADKLYNSPEPDWDVLGPDGESPQLAAAAIILEAFGDFLRARVPDAPRGIITEIHAAIADVAAGRTAALFERPKKAGAPSIRIREECSMVLLSAITSLLMGAGWKKREALEKVSRASGTRAIAISRFRTELHKRAGHIDGLYRHLMQDMVALEAKKHDQVRAASGDPADVEDPEIIKELKERAGLIACRVVSDNRQFRPAARLPRRERAGPGRQRATQTGRRRGGRPAES